MPKVTLNGVELFYVEKGEGRPLFLLHGLTADTTMFKQEMEHFKHQFRVIALDSRGHGKSEKPTNYSLMDHIEDVITLMDRLNISRAHIIGVSMGSYVAQGVAIHYPERVDKLLLIVSKAHGKTSSTQELLAKHAEEIEGLNEEEQMIYMTKYIYHNLEAIEEGRQANQIEATVLTAEQVASANEALKGFDFRDDLHKITAKTLVISGKYDGLNPPERGEEVASLIPNASFVVFEHSGHGPNIEESQCFYQLVDHFLNH